MISAEWLNEFLKGLAMVCSKITNKDIHVPHEFCPADDMKESAPMLKENFDAILRAFESVERPEIKANGAAKIASEHFKTMTCSKILCEEIGLSDNNTKWLVTLSYYKTGKSMYGLDVFETGKSYKQFEIDSTNGDIVSIKDMDKIF